MADSDLIGQGEVSVQIISTTEPAGKRVILTETVRPGLFQGSITLVATNSADPAGELRARAGDLVRAEYFDASANNTVHADARVETVPPTISNVQLEPDYVEAVVRWDTSEPTDALVQFGESILLNRTSYDGELSTSHELVLEGLQPDHVYYFQVVSRDNAGNTTVDDNQTNFYSFRTLRPFSAPWYDDLEHGNANWLTFDSEESEPGWNYGVPQNGVAAYSPVNAWGSNLKGAPVSQIESFLISPPIDLTGGNRAALRFMQNYDFSERDGDIFEFGEVMLITNTATAPISLGEVTDFSFDWEEVEFNLSPHVGKVVYIVWYYFLLSIESYDRPGWLVDDVSVTIENIAPGVIQVTNNLAQTLFVLSGPVSRTGRGWGLSLTNAPPGDYRVLYGEVPYYQTPRPQTNALISGQTLVFRGDYTFADANNNGISDVWEQNYFQEVSGDRTDSTDTDGDGVTDRGEFVSGTDPIASASKLALRVSTNLADGAVRLQWASVAGRAYRVEGSTDALRWAPVSDWIPATAAMTSHTLSAPQSGAPFLFRLEVRP